MDLENGDTTIRVYDGTGVWELRHGLGGYSDDLKIFDRVF